MIEPAPAGSVLSREAILALLDGPEPLVSGLANPDEQVQPNGVDLSVESVWALSGAGQLGPRAEDRQVPSRVELPFGPAGVHLEPGVYIVRLVEEVRLPDDLMALARPRSSLLRSGCAVHTAVWDAGYHGRSEVLLAIYAAQGFRLLAGARILQMVFFRLTGATRGYAGRYQHEHLG